MRKKTAIFFSLILALGSFFVGLELAEANSCLDCKQSCRKGGNDCKKAGPKGACRLARPICTMFKNAQCPAAEKICLQTRCGTRPDCDPNPLPGGLSGDPHFRSLDRARFDYQGVGEFVVARSEKAGIEIQARLAAYGSSVSVATVLAIKARGHVIAFRSGDAAPTIDDKQTLLVAAGTPITSDLILSPTTDGRTLVTVGATDIWVYSKGSAASVHMAPAPDSKNTWQGLLGNFDGDAKNDFALRDGKSLDAEDISADALHKEWAHSWRLTADESFLPYKEGESTATFTDVDFPKEYVSVASLDKEAFAKARAVCLAKGIGEGDALEDCIYDVGVTGDESFADALALASKVQGAFRLSFAGELSMRAQDSAYQGQEIPIYWALPEAKGGKIVILAGDKVISQQGMTAKNPAMVRMPAEPGDYLVELRHGDATRSQAIKVSKATAALQAPDLVDGASVFEVSWKGPAGRGDYVAFAELGDTDPKKYMTYAWAGTKASATFQAPATPGTYQLHYVLAGAKDRKVIASRNIKVGKASATLALPKEPTVGETFLVTWTGPGGRSDYVDLVDKGHTETSGYLTFGWTVTNRSTDPKGRQTSMQAPVTAGSYTLRYVAQTAKGREVLKEKTFRVVEGKATIAAPKEVMAKARFDVSYEGLFDSDGYIAIVKRGEADPAKYESYRWLRKKLRTMTAPGVAGDYELVFVIQGAKGERRILSRKGLTVGAP